MHRLAEEQDRRATIEEQRENDAQVERLFRSALDRFLLERTVLDDRLRFVNQRIAELFLCVPFTKKERAAMDRRNQRDAR